MTTVSIPQQLRKALQTQQAVRNGFLPAATTQSWLQQEANFLLRHRWKVACEFSTPISAIPAASTSSRPRWRAVYHSGSHAQYLVVHFECAQSPTSAGAPPDPYAKLLVENVSGTDIGTAVFHFGANPAASVTDTPNFFGSALMPVLDTSSEVVIISPNTDYYLTFTDEDDLGRSTSRMIAATVIEVSLPADTDNGYFASNVVASSPIFDADRSYISALRTAWKRNASNLWNWASHTDATAPATAALTTDVNIIDASTAVSAATPGVTLDLTNRSTVRRTTVPCKMFVYAKNTDSDGIVKLKDSGGSTLLSINITSATAAWYSGTVSLPATSAKYDIHHREDSGASTQTTYAVSLMAYET